MLGCRPCNTPIDKNHQISAESGDSVDRETSKIGWEVDIPVPYET
jgi:hypothetical protein